MDCLPKELTMRQAETGSLAARKEEDPFGRAEAVIVRRILEKHGGNRIRAAQELGISRATLWRKIKRYGL